MKNLFYILLFISTYSFAQSIEEKKEVSVLFIGNSLTYYNNLPKLVKRAANQKKVKMYVEMIAYPNYAIIDHWNGGKVQKLISNKKFDYVIIQQGPSSRANGRKMLIDTGKKFKDLCTQNNAQLCYFMVWPSRHFYQSFDKVIENYSEAAKINNAILLPVGKEWKEYFDNSNKFNYYGKDGFHPSLKGSKVAANIIVENLLKELK
ncbi:SGNH/GDSL hydrolase family protein [Tenacibaculum xiamenense]|uniref:SGNH/GDSL hydrolase family protein n=1 Tax=Tenacibaculum xiamenense TaxID=1261553 RepID=UPI003893E439